MKGMTSPARPYRASHRAAMAGALLFSSIVLVGCGGGGTVPPVVNGPSAQELEDSEASATVAGLLAFVQAQIARTDADMAEPRDISGINPPSDDGTEPEALL